MNPKQPDLSKHLDKSILSVYSQHQDFEGILSKTNHLVKKLTTLSMLSGYGRLGGIIETLPRPENNLPFFSVIFLALTDTDCLREKAQNMPVLAAMENGISGVDYILDCISLANPEA